MAINQSNGVEASSQNGGDDFSPPDDVDPVMASSTSDSSDLDSGMESDEPDITSFLEPGTELIQVGNQTLALPLDLCELPNLSEILSIETWNNILSDSDRFELAKYLPDMDEETLAHTLSELFKGENFNFESPSRHFFEQLKGGLFDPRVVLYRNGMNFVKKRGYYCNLQKYQDSMVGKIMSIKEALQNVDENYDLEERIRFVNIIRNQESLLSESEQGTESESGYKSDTEFDNSDSDSSVQFAKVNLGENLVNGGVFRERLVNGLPNKRNKNLGFAKIGKLGTKKPQLRYEAEERELEERETTSLHGSRGKNKNRKNLGFKVKGSKEKSDNILCGINKDGIDFLSPEFNYSPNKSEETESDLSQKDRVMEKLIDLEKPEKKTKKYNKNERKSKKEKKVNKKVKKEKKDKGVPRGRKGGRKRKSDDLNNNNIINNNNENINIITKTEINEDNNLVEIPVIQETEIPLIKRRKNKTLITPKSEKSTKKKTLISPNSENSIKKRKRNEQNNSPEDSKKKKGRKNLELAPDFVPVPVQQVKHEEIVPVPVPEPKKKAYIPIKPTFHSDFSFSIIHLLSSVRKAMLNNIYNNNNNIPVENPEIKSEEQSENGTSLTVQEITERVRSDPLDLSILTTQEPLTDLIRGVLRILSSKQAPLGIKSWKPLVSYTSLNKSYHWTGPVVKPTGDDSEEEQMTSPDAWAVPHKSLVKLVDSFANWLKEGEETLKKIANLGPPPVPVHSDLTEKDRFKDIKSLKSQYTIFRTNPETQSYFHKEELIRYSIPDRAFSYTATDGQKSMVAPLVNRSSNKKFSKKPRDHFMLNPERPPHVTILGLVRDAASRLPGSIGTRADVCTLIRDSQFVNADVAEEKLSEVVSGALDRLHYQEDPCVRFDGDRKLWVYLHRNREEEDFEEDGNQSTKKWRKPKKEGTDLDAQGHFRNNDNKDEGEGEESVGYVTGQTGQESPVGFGTGQTGREKMDVFQTGRMGQEELPGFRTGQMGREKPVGFGTGREKPIGFGTGSMGQKNPLGFGTGQMGQENSIGFGTSQTGQEDQLGFVTGQMGRNEQLWGHHF